jgi:hypothetical protein
MRKRSRCSEIKPEIKLLNSRRSMIPTRERLSPSRMSLRLIRKGLKILSAIISDSYRQLLNR